jgi:cytochrome c oxidase subunit 3
MTAAARTVNDRGQMRSRAATPAWPRTDVVRFGVWVFLATVVMLFAAFASALLVRRAGSDWQPVALPPVVWASATTLVAASALAEAARRSAHQAHWRRARQRLAAVAGLGLLFLAGQALAWQQLAGRGLGLAGNPHAAFFYVLSGLHGLHLAAALVVAAWGAAESGPARRAADDLGPAWADVAASLWHVLTGLWLGVLVLLAWRG